MKHLSSLIVQKAYSAVFLFFATVSVAQTAPRFACFYGETANPDLACLRLKQYSFNPSSNASDAVKNILRPLGLAPNFVLVPCDQIQNCAALILDDGFRYIVYDKHFMEAIATQAQTNWVFTSILAHEVGHHLQGHTTRGATLVEQRKQELEADKFSGFILAKLNATLEQAQAAMQLLPDPPIESQSDHPLRWRRLKAIKEGYEDAMNNVPSTTPDNEPVSSTEHTTLTLHNIINSSKFPSLKESWHKNYELRQAIYSDDRWYVFMAKDPELNLQSYSLSEDFPSSDIEKWWKQKKRITGITYDNNRWLLVMSRLNIEPAQRYRRNNIFPEEAIREDWNAGFYVTDIAYGNNEWVAVMNSKSSINYEDQYYNTSRSFPQEDIREYWKKGYIINVLKYLNNQWVLVMTKFEGSASIGQRWGTRKSFPLDLLLKNEADGYLLKCAAYDGRTWAIVMNKQISK